MAKYDKLEIAVVWPIYLSVKKFGKFTVWKPILINPNILHIARSMQSFSCSVCFTYHEIKLRTKQ